MLLVYVFLHLKQFMLMKFYFFMSKALVKITDQQIYRDLVAGEEDNSFLKE